MVYPPWAGADRSEPQYALVGGLRAKSVDQEEGYRAAVRLAAGDRKYQVNGNIMIGWTIRCMLKAASTRLAEIYRRLFVSPWMRCHHPAQRCPYGTGWRGSLLYDHLSASGVSAIVLNSYTWLTREVVFQVRTRELQPDIPAGCIAEIRLFYARRPVSRVYLSMIGVRRNGTLTVYWLLVPPSRPALPEVPGADRKRS